MIFMIPFLSSHNGMLETNEEQGFVRDTGPFSVLRQV